MPADAEKDLRELICHAGVLDEVSACRIAYERVISVAMTLWCHGGPWPEGTGAEQPQRYEQEAYLDEGSPQSIRRRVNDAVVVVSNVALVSLQAPMPATSTGVRILACALPMLGEIGDR